MRKNVIKMTKIVIGAALLVVFSGCTVVKYEAEGKSFHWMSTKKVLITADGEKLSISTDPDSQYIMASKLIELAGSVK